MLRWGRQILADYDCLHNALGGNRKGLAGVLRLGVIPAAMPSVSFLSEQFQARHPRASIGVRSMSSRAILRGLDNFEIDGGLTYLDNEPLENVHCLTLYRERYLLACHPAHPFAGRTAVTWADAVTQPLCLLSDDMQDRRILDGVAAGARLEIRPKVVSNFFLGVASHLRNGGWCAIVPHTFAFVFGGTEDLALRDMVEPSRRQLIGLVLSDRVPQSPMAAALQDCAAKVDFERRFDAANR